MQMWRYCDTERKKMQIYIFFLFQIEISSHSLQFQNVTDHSVQPREKKTDSNLWQLRDQVKCLVLKMEKRNTYFICTFLPYPSPQDEQLENFKPSSSHLRSFRSHFKRFIWWEFPAEETNRIILLSRERKKECYGFEDITSKSFRCTFCACRNITFCNIAKAALSEKLQR